MKKQPMQYFYQQVATPNSQPTKHYKMLQRHTVFLHRVTFRKQAQHCVVASPSWLCLLHHHFCMIFFPFPPRTSPPCPLKKPAPNSPQKPQELASNYLLLSKTRLLQSHFVCIHVHMCTHLFAYQTFSLWYAFFQVWLQNKSSWAQSSAREKVQCELSPLETWQPTGLWQVHSHLRVSNARHWSLLQHTLFQLCSGPCDTS